jgi:small subunit ribosomal protein S8
MTTDTIADMVTRLRNANLVRHQIVQVLSTKLTIVIAKILKEEGYISDFEEFEENGKKYIFICLKYFGQNRKPIITTIKRISKPGQRVFSPYKGFSKVIDVLKYEQGTAIISTSIGVMTHYKATKLKKGGEILCYIG